MGIVPLGGRTGYDSGEVESFPAGLLRNYNNLRARRPPSACRERLFVLICPNLADFDFGPVWPSLALHSSSALASPSSQISRTSGNFIRSRQRCTRRRQFGGHRKSLRASIFTLPGQSLVFTCTRTTSALPMPMTSHVPKDPAARVHWYPAASRTLMERCSLRVPLRFAFLGMESYYPPFPD